MILFELSSQSRIAKNNALEFHAHKVFELLVNIALGEK